MEYENDLDDINVPTHQPFNGNNTPVQQPFNGYNTPVQQPFTGYNSPAPQQQQPAVPNKKMKLCKTCGATIAKSAKRCPVCGAKNKKPIYKRVWFWLICIIVLIVIVNWAYSIFVSPSNKTISYKTYTVDGITFEIPDSWEIEKDSDGYLTSKNLADSYFSVMTNKNFTKSQFDSFNEYLPDIMNRLNGTTIVSSNKNQYGSYKAYDYIGKAVIRGKTEPVKVTALQGNNSIVIIVLLYADDNYDYETIYSHILSSIK